MAVKGAAVHIYGDWDGSGVKRATKDLSKFERQAKGFSSNFTKSFAGLGATIGGVVAFGAIADQMKQMAQAAAQDQKSVVALGKAMSNVGMGAQTAAMEDYVKATMLATGTSDELIRQGLTRLTVATGDAAKSQKLLNLALDLSAAGYGDVVGLSAALSKAANGNITALKRLGVPLDENAVKAKDFGSIVDDLSSKFRGQAKAAANTYAGQMERINTAVGEAQETIGYALLNAVNDASAAFGGTGGLVDVIAAVGDETANLVTGLGLATTALSDLVAQADDLKASDTGLSILDLGKAAFLAIPGMKAGVTALQVLTDQGAKSNAEQEKADRIAGAVAGRYSALAASIRGVSSATDDGTEAYKKQISAVDRLKDSLDRLNGKNRSIIGDRISLKRTKAGGPDATGGKKGNIVTADDRKVWGLDVAQQAEALAKSLADKGQMGKARSVLDANRAFLTQNVGKDFAKNVLGTPAWLDRGNAGQRAWGQRLQQGSQTNNYYFGDLLVRDAADAAEQARRASRLKALGNGRVAEAARYSAMAGAA